MENDARPRLPDVVAVPDARGLVDADKPLFPGVTGGLQVTEQYTVEIEGEPKPACVTAAIMRAYF